MSDSIEEWKKANEYDKIREYLKNTHPDVLEGFGEWNEEQKAIKLKTEIAILKEKSRKMIGFYKENYPHHEVKSRVFPSVERTNRFGANYDKLDMIQYIESLPICQSYRGMNRCNYIAENYPDEQHTERGVYYTDGEYTISSIALLHINLFEITLPQKFVDKAIRAGYEPAHALKDSLWERGEAFLVDLMKFRLNNKDWKNQCEVVSEAMSLYHKERSEQE